MHLPALNCSKLVAKSVSPINNKLKANMPKMTVIPTFINLLPLRILLLVIVYI